MIKTPVSYNDRFNRVEDADGDVVMYYISEDIGNETVKRINMHDEFVAMLKDIALVDGGSICIRSKLAKARELLEKCK